MTSVITKEIQRNRKHTGAEICNVSNPPTSVGLYLGNAMLLPSVRPVAGLYRENSYMSSHQRKGPYWLATP